MALNYKKFLFDPHHDTVTNPANTSVVKFRKDIDFLVEALEKAYPAKWIMSEAQWKHIISDLYALKFDENTPAELFGTQIADILWQVPDGHLKVRLRDQILGHEFKNHLRKPTTGSNLAKSSSNECWKLEHRSAPLGNIPVIAISSFPQASEPPWVGFSEAIRNTLNAPAIIVDLRGNGGGDSTRAHEMASTFLGRDLEEDWVREIVCETAEAVALQINTYENIIWKNYRSKNLAPPMELVQILETLKERAESLATRPLSDSKTIHQQVPREMTNLPDLGFKNKIFVLIDPATISSGEWTALYLKKHPNAILVGENTYGMIHFGNTGRLQLPHSKLSIQLCMKINELTDGRFFEKTGIAPDVPVSNKDSLDYVISELI